MGFLNWLSDRVATNLRTRDVTFDDIIKELDHLGIGKSAASIAVNTGTALQVSAVWACARVISEGVAQLPLDIIEETADKKRTSLTASPAYRLLNHRPNSFQTPFEFREVMTMHAVLAQQGMALKVGSPAAPTELLPLMPDWVEIKRNADWSLTYTVRVKGQLIGVFPESQMFVVRGPLWENHIGADIVRLAREAIGLSLAAEKTQSTMQKNGSRLSGVLSSEVPIGPEAMTKLREAWKKAMSGVDNAGKVAILDNGFKFSKISMSGVDSQLMETRKFQIEEVCRFMRIFPQMIMQVEGTANFASSEAFFSAHVTHSMRPWLRRWTGSIGRDLLPRAGKAPPYTSALFDTNEMLRPTAEGRGKFYRDLIELGVMTRNEARDRENLERLDGLDEPLTPLNMDHGQESEQ